MTDIGATLREARMRRRIDITEVESATKIRAKYLRAMEDEEWSVLPGPTYVRSFLRTYADYLGLDSRWLVEEYKRRYDRPSEADLVPISPATARHSGAGHRPPRRPGLGTAVVVALVLLAGGLWAIGKAVESGGEGTTPPRTSTQTAEQRRAAQRRRQAAKRRAAAQRARRVRLQVIPTASVYVCLVDGKGDRLIPGVTLSPARPSATFSRRRFRINLGNASARLKLNGKVISLPPSATPLGYEITPRGRRPLAAGQRPTCG
jgi:cytoskeleton protein RodZ